MKQEIFKELNDYFAIVSGSGNKYIAGGYQILADSIMKIIDKHEAENAPKEQAVADAVESKESKDVK